MLIYNCSRLLKKTKMNRLITFIFFITMINFLSAQDNIIQEPIKNFDKLWVEFNDRYAFFEIKNINWNDVYKKYRPLINERTSNDSLFTVCNKMLLKLKDGHVGLVQYDRDKKIIRASDDGSPSILLSKFPFDRKSTPNLYQLFDLTESTLKKNGFTDFTKSKSQILQYSTSKDYGYLLIQAMEGFKIFELGSFINDAIKSFKNKKGVIIDIRTNGGGSDNNSHKIANRFVDKTRTAYYKKTRKKGTNAYTLLKTKHLKPSGKQQFTKPIIILTSDFTASAADVFALMMKELPYVTIIGDNTQGIFSDIYSFSLPNKWRVNLSHQQYFSADMKNYEGVGVQPDIKLLNEPEDITSGKDLLIVKAIEVLNKKTTANN
jgi:carboxyl-terminal processing protease